MKLLSRGLTKITASVVLLMIVITTSILTWTLITTATPNTNHIITQQSIIKLEAVSYSWESNKVVINIRSNNHNIKQYRIVIYRVDGKVLEEVPATIMSTETLYTGLTIIIVKPCEKLTPNEYILQLIIDNKTLEYTFKL